MSESSIYTPIWQKYRPAILSLLKSSLTEPQEYKLSKQEFETIGGRSSAGYGFNLEVKEGIVVNNIRGTAVARDLFEVLKNSPSAKEFMLNNYFKINMTKDFKLKIQSLQ